MLDLRWSGFCRGVRFGFRWVGTGRRGRRRIGQFRPDSLHLRLRLLGVFNAVLQHEILCQGLHPGRVLPLQVCELLVALVPGFRDRGVVLRHARSNGGVAIGACWNRFLGEKCFLRGLDGKIGIQVALALQRLRGIGKRLAVNGKRVRFALLAFGFDAEPRRVIGGLDRNQFVRLHRRGGLPVRRQVERQGQQEPNNCILLGIFHRLLPQHSLTILFLSRLGQCVNLSWGVGEKAKG